MEGMRVYQQGVYCLDRHLDRLEDSALQWLRENPQDFIRRPSKLPWKKWDDKGYPHPIDINDREKITSGMDPRLNQNGCTLIVLAEWKPPVYDNEKEYALLHHRFAEIVQCTWILKFTIIISLIISCKIQQITLGLIRP